MGKAVFHGAHLATRDDTAFGLYYDYLTLVVLAGHTDDAALETELRAALDAAWQLFGAGDLAGARAALAGPLAAPSASDFVYRAVGHGHLDMAWLWPLRETRRKAARTYTRALNAIERRPGYIYGTSQPQQMAWMKELQPALYARMQQAVADGRMELQGSFWIEPDTNLPSGESLVRQALVGRRFLQEEFGLTDEQLRMCWLPDTFGYNGNLPQILKKSGMDWFQTIKLAWNKVNTFPHRTFHWQGIDGSSVLVHMPPEGDYNSRGAADGLLKGLRAVPRDRPRHGAARLRVGRRRRRAGRDPPRGARPRARRRRAGTARPAARRALAPHPPSSATSRPATSAYTHRGELYLEAHQGTYTTQGAIKKHNRIVERMLHEVEALSVIAGEDTRAALEPPGARCCSTSSTTSSPAPPSSASTAKRSRRYVRIEGELRTLTRDLTEELSDGRHPRRGEPHELPPRRARLRRRPLVPRRRRAVRDRRRRAGRRTRSASPPPDR